MFTIKDSEVRQLPKIEDVNHFKRGVPTEKGLFSEQIFGPLHDYTCQCRKYWGPSSGVDRCPTCKVPITTSKMRCIQLARIELVTNVINPLMRFLDKRIHDVCLGRKRMFIDKEGELNFENTDEYQHPAEIASILHELTELPLDFILLKNIIVVPPAFRPAQDKWLDDLNQKYTSILAVNKDLPIPTPDLRRILYLTVYELFDLILTRLSKDKRKSIIRGYCLGRELDLSGRSVIVPDPDLKVNEIVLPKEFKDTWGVDFDRVILNRQPTLHRRSMLAFKVKYHDSKTIKIPPAVTTGFNADFDGDSVLADVTLRIGNEYKTVNISKIPELEIQDSQGGNSV